VAGLERSGTSRNGASRHDKRPRHGGRRVALGRSVTAASTIADTLLEQRHPSVARRLTPRELRVECVVATLFGVVAIPLASIGWNSGEYPVSAVLLVATYAFVARVRFQVGPGLVRPTQLVLVPMLFLLPATAVPLLVAVGLVLSELPEVVRRTAHPQRFVVAVADSWHAIAPAIVVALLVDADSGHAPWRACVLALLAQFAIDFAVSTVREGLGAGIHPRQLAPVLAIVYVVDALLAPIGYLAVLASREDAFAYLLAVAPGALLALIASERRSRIERDLALGRAYRQSTRSLDEQAEMVRRQAGRIERTARRVGEPVPAGLDRAALERLLLTTAVDAVQADCGRLNLPADDGTSIEHLVRDDADAGALRAAEAALLAGPLSQQVTIGDLTAVAIPLHARGASLTIGRSGAPFSAAERELLEHLAAQAAVSLENARLQTLMAETQEDLRAILEGVADGVTAEDAVGNVVYANSAAIRLLDPAHRDAIDVTDEHGAPLRAERLPAQRVLRGQPAPPLVLRSRRARTGETRCARVKASPVFDRFGDVRLAISVIEDITEIKQVEEGQRFLAETSRVLAGALDVSETLPAVARLVASRIADWCTIRLGGTQGSRCVAMAHADASKAALAEALEREHPTALGEVVGLSRVLASGGSELHETIDEGRLATAAQDPRALYLLRSLGLVSAICVPLKVRDQVLGAITLATSESGRRFGRQDLALAEDLGLRVGSAVEHARLYRTRSAIAQTLQASLLPPVLPEIPGLETAALFRPAGEDHEVGGDFFDLFSSGTRQWFAVMGDVCGKGAEAAAVTALARYTIRAAVVRHRSPVGILRWLNDAMLRQQRDVGRFATVACARFDLDHGDVFVTVACGGHPCPRVLRSTGLVEELGSSGTLLGAVSDIHVEDRTTRLAAEDAIVFYTDGLTEAGAPQRVWTPSQLDAAVAGARHQTARGIVDHLARCALGDAQAPLRDDIALLAVRAC
jgi:PAS domain S-box-containing protein